MMHLSRARNHLREERFDLARQELELAELAKPNDEDVLNLLSVIEFKRGYYNEAAQAARSLLKENPGSAILHSNLGLILFKSGVLGEAEQELRRAIDLKPDHVRSHLYLGLLYRIRGKLGLALEHLRFAGAKRVVAEIEETLRRSAKDNSLRSGVSEAASRPASERGDLPVSPPLLKLAGAPAPSATLVAAEARPSVAAVRGVPVPPVEQRTTLPPPPEPVASPEATAKLRASDVRVAAAALPARDGRAGSEKEEARPLFNVRIDGGLEIASRGVVFVRKGSVVWYSGKMRFSAEPSFRGTRLEKILRAEGRGYLLVNDPGRSAFRRDLAGESLYLEGGRLLALDHGLSFRLEPIHDFRMNRRVDILKIQGRGSVILSVAGALLAHEVSHEFPLNVSSRDLVAWTGDLIPSVLEDRFLEEVMMPDVGSAPKIRFEGEGTVLTEPPRPRRRASDLSRPTEADRRSS